MTKSIVLLLACPLIAFADVSFRNGTAITTASTVNGKTPIAAINGQTVIAAAVTLQNVFAFAQADAVSSLTFSTTVASGSKLLLLVAINTQTVDESTVAYGAASLTHVATESLNEGYTTEYWYLINPAVGTANIVITPASAASVITAVATVWTGVNQSTPLGTAHENTDDLSTTPTNWCASAVGEVPVCMFGNSGTATVGAGQTLITNYGVVSEARWMQMSSRVGATAPVPAFTMSAGEYWTGLAVSLKP